MGKRPKRSRHRVPRGVGFTSATDLPDRYEQEVADTVRRAERAWQSAARRADHAERRHAAAPTDTSAALMGRVRAEATRLWEEYVVLDRMMRSGQGRNWSGRGSVGRVGPAGSGT